MPTLGRRRALGQHFLRDKTVCDRIAQKAIELTQEFKCTQILEIGPGRGAITEPILELKGHTPLVLAERDSRLVAEWRVRGGARVEEGDFLDLAEEKWLNKTPLAVVSNLPYSAGTAILTRLAAHPEKIPFMVLMFQAEVAQRIRAEPSTKAWGSLSVWIQNRWDVEKLLSVPPGAFSPPPEVNSEVVVLRARKEPRIPVPTPADEKAWEGLLKACFAHRRKMLRAGLKGFSGPRNALEASGVDGTKRAESLSWDEWARLFAALGSTTRA